MKSLKEGLSLKQTLEALDNNRYVIPSFQRNFVWSSSDIKDLLNSIFSDYHIGNLLLWESSEENKKELQCTKIYGCIDKENDASQVVLDGQQRLTSIYYAFVNPQNIPLHKNKTPTMFYIDIKKYLSGADDDFFFFENLQNRIAQCESEEYQLENKIFPIKNLHKEDFLFSSFWKKYAKKYGKDEVRDFSRRINETFSDFRISSIKLSKETDIARICGIFEKLNSKGQKLDIFDLMNALLLKHNVKLKNDLWKKSKEKHKDSIFLEDKEKKNILQVMSIIKQDYCTAKHIYYLIPGKEKNNSIEGGVLIKDGKEFKDFWEDACKYIKKSSSLISKEYGVKSKKYLPQLSLLISLTAMYYFLDKEDILNAKNQNKIKQWWFISILSSRSSSESTLTADFKDMKEWFKEDSNVPDFIKNFLEDGNFGKLKEKTKSGAVYHFIFNLLFLKGAKDFYTFENNEVNEGNLEDHHIVPKSKASELKLENSEINQVLNRTLITANTNKKIRDKYPSKYLKDLLSSYGDEKKLHKMLENHFISAKAYEILKRDNFQKQDFIEFIDERRKSIIEYIKEILEIKTSASAE